MEIPDGLLQRATFLIENVTFCDRTTDVGGIVWEKRYFIPRVSLDGAFWFLCYREHELDGLLGCDIRIEKTWENLPSPKTLAKFIDEFTNNIKTESLLNA
jgi:hypothetical protein